MFGKLMDRYYYGKSGKGDYTPEDLPKNRWQLFWEMLRVRFTGLVKLNLLYMLAWIPVMIVLAMGIMVLFSSLNDMAIMQEKVYAGEILQSEYDAAAAGLQGSLAGLLHTTLLLLWPCVAITGPFTCGLCYVTRNWARDEHSFMMSDFWQAVKGNWKKGLLCSVITGAVPYFMYVCANFYGQMAQQNMFFLLPQVLTMIAGALWLCAVMYMYPQMITYDLNFRGVVRNAFLMAIGKLPQTVGLKLLSVVPALVVAVFLVFTGFGLYAILIYALYYIVIGFALSRFVAASYTNGVFDQYLNSKIEGAEIGRGLYTETDEDEEEPIAQDESEQ